MLTMTEVTQQFTADLQKSGLLPSDVPNWRPVDAATLNVAIGRSAGSVGLAGFIIPFTTLDGSPLKVDGLPFVRAKLLGEIQKNEPRYLSAAGSGSHIYMPTRTRDRLVGGDYAGQSLIITEGEKKAEAAAKAGLLAVALSGITMGLVRKDSSDDASSRSLLDELQEIVAVYKGRAGAGATVLVVFDSDGYPRDKAFAGGEKVSARSKIYTQNKNVYWENIRLAKALREANTGLRVGSAWCEPADKNGKQGLDDWLVHAKEAAMAAVQAAGSGASAITQKMADEAADRNAAVAAQGYEPLGYTTAGTGSPAAVVWSKPTKTIQVLSQFKSADIKLTMGSEYAHANWGKVSEAGLPIGIDLQRAENDIISGCHHRGHWSGDKARGGGVWLDDGELLINSRAGLFAMREGQMVELGDESRFTGRFAYESTSAYWLQLDTAAVDDDTFLDDFGKLTNWLSSWGWSAKHDAPVMVGWLLAQSYLGALEARPNVIITGESGAGKTVLSQFCNEFLTGASLRVDNLAETTEPGLRQTVGKDCLTLLLDEAEPGAEDSATATRRLANLNRIINSLRGAYSTSDQSEASSSASLKGSSSGRAQSFKLRYSAMLFGIGRPQLAQQDRNRMIFFRVMKNTRAAQPPVMSHVKDVGWRMRMWMWAHYDEFSGWLAALVQRAEAATGVEARYIQTIGTALAALATATGLDHSNADDFAQVCGMLKAVFEQQKEEDGGGDESDAEKALHTLLATKMQVERDVATEHSQSVIRKTYTVFEVLDKAQSVKSMRHDTVEQRHLKMNGMARVEKDGAVFLFVANESAELRRLLKDTTFATQSVVSVLANLVGVRQYRLRLAGANPVRGLIVPMPECQVAVASAMEDD